MQGAREPGASSTGPAEPDNLFLSPCISPGSQAAVPLSSWNRAENLEFTAVQRTKVNRTFLRTVNDLLFWPGQHPLPPRSPRRQAWAGITSLYKAGPRHQGSVDEAWGDTSRTLPCSLNCQLNEILRAP